MGLAQLASAITLQSGLSNELSAMYLLVLRDLVRQGMLNAASSEVC